MRAAQPLADVGEESSARSSSFPGIMGTELDSVNRKGDSDRIWINFVRLIAGRIGDLELNPEGESAHHRRSRPPRGRPPQDVRAAAHGARHALARAAVPVRLARGHRQERRAARRRDQGVRCRRARASRRALDGRARLPPVHPALPGDVEGDGRHERQRQRRPPDHARHSQPRLVRHPDHALRSREAPEAPREGRRGALA